MDYVIVYFKSCFIKLCINSIIRRYGMRDTCLSSSQFKQCRSYNNTKIKKSYETYRNISGLDMMTVTVKDSYIKRT